MMAKLVATNRKMRFMVDRIANRGQAGKSVFCDGSLGIPEASLRRRVTFREFLARGFDVAVEHEQHVGVVVLVREVPGLAALLLHAQVLLQVIDGEGFDLRVAERERIAL